MSSAPIKSIMPIVINLGAVKAEVDAAIGGQLGGQLRGQLGGQLDGQLKEAHRSAPVGFLHSPEESQKTS
jgi:hypothetical protein